MISGVGNIGAMSPATTIAKSGVTGAASGSDFGQVLASMATGTVDALKAGEAAATAGIQGTAPVQQVVQSVMTAEQALQTALAVRDKLVSAYQQISQMQI